MRYTDVQINRLENPPGDMNDGIWYFVEFTHADIQYTQLIAVYRYKDEDEAIAYSPSFESVECPMKILKRVLQMARWDNLRRDSFRIIDDPITLASIHWESSKPIVIERYVEDTVPNTTPVTYTKYRILTADNFRELLLCETKSITF